MNFLGIIFQLRMQKNIVNFFPLVPILSSAFYHSHYSTCHSPPFGLVYRDPGQNINKRAWKITLERVVRKNIFLQVLNVTAGFPAETYLGSRMRGGGLFERWPRGHRVKTSVMSRFPRFFRSVLVHIISVLPEFYRCNIVASPWVVLMAFRVLNVQVKVDLYMVCRRSQLHWPPWFDHWGLANAFCSFNRQRLVITMDL